MNRDAYQEPVLREMLALSFVAYLGDDDIRSTHKIDKDLPACFESVLAGSPLAPNLPSNGWDLVWGPEVYKLPWALETDNLMYAAVKSTDSVHKLAIGLRGTNPLGLLDWLVEDFEVHNMVSWKEATGSSICEKSASTSQGGQQAMISEGTQKALAALQGLEDAKKGHLKEYLANWCKANKGDTPLEVYVTGHSLGGLLTPVFSLWLAEELWQGEDAACHGVPLKPIFFAGPTPGNKAYASCVENELLKVGDGLRRIHEPLDIVPYAWTREGCESTVPYLYEPSIQPDDTDWAFINWAVRATKGHDYAQINPDTPPLCWSKLSGTKEKKGTKEPSLLKEAEWQHHYGYLYGLEMDKIGIDTGLCPPLADLENLGK